MTQSEERPATLASAFDFARRQRDPDFRRYLHEIGVTSDHDIVIAFDDDPVASVVARIVQNDTSSPCLIAIPHPDEPYGFRMMFAEAGPARKPWLTDRPDPVKVGKDASIGMVYSALASCGEFVPSEWVRPVLFTQVQTLA